MAEKKDSSSKTTAAKKTTTTKQTETKTTTAAKAASTASTKSTPSKSAPAATAATAKPATTSTAKPTATVKPAAMAKPAKVEKVKHQVSTSVEEDGDVTIIPLNRKNVKFLFLAAVSFILVVAIMLGTVCSVYSCKYKASLPHFSSTGPADILPATTVSLDRPAYGYESVIGANDDSAIENQLEYEYATTTAVGYSSKILDKNVARVKPIGETRDERNMFSLGDEVETAIRNAGTVRYPKYGYTMSSVLGSTEARDALINESDYLSAYGTYNNSGNGSNGVGSYNMMDKDGYLYFVNNGTITPATYEDGTQRQLYKHTAAEGMYLEGFGTIPMISDTQPAVKKEITLRPRGYSSYSVTGLYAPAGEVIKIELSPEDMEATGGITIHIGQALYNGQSNNIWTAKGQMQRFPNILNTMVVNKNTATLENGVYTAYVGSFIGGPIYIRNTSATFKVTITGGLTYQHFILGYTTPEEFEANKSTTVPYFDLEVWHYGVLHSGPLYYASSFSYDDLYKAAILWEKVSSVTTTGSNQGIVFLYDPFVAAGAAVAFPGRSSVNCPMGWMTSSLNYNAIVTSGSWGNFHEYHHNFQGYGVGNGGEVTNNGLNLVSYALFTKISANRGIGTFGAQGLGGWNNYTSATWALEETLKIARANESPSNGNQGLALYATLLHNFGADNYMKAKVYGGGQSYAAYMNAWQAVTHNNMYYYFNDILKGTGISNNADPSYPMFVPVSCVYQTGRSYMYDGEKKYFQTMQPYVIPYGEEFNIDLNRYSAPGGMYSGGSIVMPEGFDYRIKSVTQPSSGTIRLGEGKNLIYTPGTEIRSGQIIVTLEIIKTSGTRFNVDDVDLVLEFEQSHETNKMTLERTTYSFTEANMYTDAREAYENGYAGYESKNDRDHSNPTQNANTDIWYCTENTISNFPNADPDIHVAKENSIDELRGKLYFQEEGKYRIYLRGRLNCAVYYSLDGGKTYQLGAYIADSNTSSGFRPTDENTYFDLELDGDSWVYFKEVLIVETINANMASYIGLGVGTWQDPLYTMVEKYYDADGNEVPSVDDENYDHTETLYYDNAGNSIDPDVVAAAEKTPPTNGTYVNAYRSDYEFPDNSSFESEYFYIRNYNYNYVGDTEVITQTHTPTYMEDVGNYRPWDDDNELLGLGNLFDGDSSTNIHTHENFIVTEDNPLILAFDMGEVVTANSLTLGVYTGNSLGPRAFPKVLVLEGSLDGETWYEMGRWSNLSSSYSGVALAFPEQQFKYFKVTVTRSNYDITSRFALSSLELSYTMRLTGNGANNISPDNKNIIFSGDGWEVEQAASVFGHIYHGKAGDTVNFEFTGTRLAVLTSYIAESNFEVWIDGKKVDSIDIVQTAGDFGITYISEKLESGNHTVQLICRGDTYIDSFAIYNEG